MNIEDQFQNELLRGPEQPLNDTFNAELFSSINGNDIKFCESLGGWHYYNGMFWEKDENTKQIRRLSDKTYNHIKNIRPTWVPSDKEAKENKEKDAMLRSWKNHVKMLGNLTKQESMIEMSKKELAESQKSFDPSLNTICLKNGVYDLNSFTFNDFDSSYMLTKQAEFEYIENADCPNWINFLNVIFLSDQELINYIQEVVGYCLTGEVNEQCFFILHGNGSNGKSTFTNTLRHAIGGYACTTRVNTLMEKRNEENSNDLARLRGMRLVSASETKQSKRLDTATIKNITSQEPITARFLHKEFFEFFPTFKVMLSCNFIPTVTEQDDGTWRRIKLIPFDHKFEDNDKIKDFEQKYLYPELPGIFNWAVEGLRRYKERGLKEPSKVILATTKYKQDEDYIGQFIKEHCEIDDGYACLRSKFYEYYRNMERNSKIGKKTLFSKIEQIGYKIDRLTFGIHKGKDAIFGIKVDDDEFLYNINLKASYEIDKYRNIGE